MTEKRAGTERTRAARLLPPLSRRAALLGFSGMALSVAVGQTPVQAFGNPVATGELPLLNLLPPGEPDRSLFAPHEQCLGPYLMIVAPMANDIVDDDPDIYGWMSGGWWRTPSHPRNSRIQEHVATLSWFLTNERPWNPYFGDPALEARLSAAISYYLSLQGPRGAWPVTYEEESLATTGFGMLALGATLENLRGSALLEPLHADIEAALLAAASWFLEISPYWTTPLRVVNQMIAGMAGSKVALNLVPDHRLEAIFTDRLDQLIEYGQSPAGYFYEPFGADHGYNFTVALPDLADLHRLTGHPGLVEMAEKFAEWYRLVSVREPDGSGWIYFSSISARTVANSVRSFRAEPDRTMLGTAFLDAVPELSPFFTAAEYRVASRAEWADASEPVPPLPKPDTSPRIILHTPLGENYPSQGDQDTQIASLPYLRRTMFSEVRSDPRGQDYLFARRPSYYLGAAFGPRESAMVHSGMGFLWHPDGGMFVHSRNDATDRAWATVLDTGESTALSDLDASFFAGDPARGIQYHAMTLPGARALGVRYTAPGLALLTDVLIDSHSITQRVENTSGGSASHHVPLVVHAGDVVTMSDGTNVVPGTGFDGTVDSVTITRGSTALTIGWVQLASTQFQSTGATYLADSGKRLHLLKVSFAGSFEISYSMQQV